MIPPLVKKAIDRHVSQGMVCGKFVTSVLENNLLMAFIHADENSLDALREIVDYLYYEVPAPAWGCKENVKKWREQGGLDGLS